MGRNVRDVVGPVVDHAILPGFHLQLSPGEQISRHYHLPSGNNHGLATSKFSLKFERLVQYSGCCLARFREHAYFGFGM
jgi:hypothetical protein